MKRIYSLILTFLLTFTATLSFHIAPTFFEKRIDGPGGYQEFTMYNNSTKTQRFKVTTLPGTGKYNGHMDKWVEFSPKIITIKPQSQSILKVFIKAPKGLAEGEYSTFLNFKSIPVPNIKKTQEEVVAPVTRIGLDMNIEIIGYIGDLKPKLEILNLKVSENKDGKAVVSFKVKNNTLKRGVWYTIDVIKNDGNYKSIEKGRVRPEAVDEIVLNMKDMKKGDVAGIRLRDSSTYENITKKEL